jgi:phospholipid/cholesterol/gamma-HCH transport system substrate-binding protein
MARGRGKKGGTGMKPFTAGLIGVILITLFAFFAFTKFNPFANPYEFNAVFETANNLKPRSPVRIAGVEVGKVKKVEALDNGAARVSLELEDKALPIHEDAELKIRPRIFLEGNFFVDLEPGSPSAPVLDKNETIPISQTKAPVQFGDVLIALQKDVRTDLQVFLKEYGKSLRKGGAAGFRSSIKYWERAYKNSAIANEATLGQNPESDLQRVLRGQARTFAALNRDPEALKDLVTSFNVTAGAFAREDAALEAAIPELRDTLVTAQPALQSLNDALPSLRRFSIEALPGVRSSAPTLRASLPFITQARLLFRPSELRGAARELRRQTPSFVRLNRTTVPLLEEGRTLSACSNQVLIPFAFSEIPDPDFPDNKGRFIDQANRGLVGLSGESRLMDANNQYFHASAVGPPQQPGNSLRPAPPPDGGSGALERRPDLPCENQEPPNLNAPAAALGAPGPGGLVIPGLPDLPIIGPLPRVDMKAQARAWQRAYPLFKQADELREGHSENGRVSTPEKIASEGGEGR